MHWIELTANRDNIKVLVNLQHASQIIPVANGNTNIIFAANAGEDVDFIQVKETPMEILTKEKVNE